MNEHVKTGIKYVGNKKLEKIKNCFTEYFGQENLRIRRIFVILLLLGDILFWVMQMVVHGEWLDGYFLPDYSDTGMDFFNMLACLDKHNPYKMKVNYPPMCFVILKVLYRFIPTSIRGDDANGFYYRELMHSQVMYILCTIILVWGTIELIKYSYKGTNKEKTVFALGIIFSGPFLFTFERGNLFIISFVCLLVFINLYDSDKTSLRWCAYFALSLSAAIKIYPAVFGLLILCKKRYKEALGTAALGVVMFVAPSFIFGGPKIFQTILQGMQEAERLQGDTGMGCNFCFGNLLKIIGVLSGNAIEQNLIISLLVPFVICLLIFVCSKDDWKKVYAIALFCIWIPNFSYTYTLLLFVLPVICFLGTDKNPSLYDYLYGLLFLFILIPLCLPKMEYLEYETDFLKLPLTMSTLIENIAICALAACILIEGVSKYLKKVYDARGVDNDRKD